MRLVAAVVMFVLSLFAFNRAAEAARIDINLASQTMQVTSTSGASYSWPISSARAGFSTPRGYYRPQRLEAMHYSRKYHMSPMPHSIFFRGGYAIHGTSAVGQLGRPASHGCIRLSPGHAAQLYALVRQEGGQIQISGSPPGSTRFAKASHKGHRKAYASARHGHKKHYASAHKPRYAAAHKKHHRATALAYAPAHPTVAESGLPGYDVFSWFGTFAPAGTPPAIIEKWNSEITRILAMREVQEKVSAIGYELKGGTPQQFAEFIRSDWIFWDKVIKSLKIKLDS